MAEKPVYTTEDFKGLCSVCGDPDAELIECTSRCADLFCFGCVENWISSNLENRTRIIKCLADGCLATFTEADIAKFGELYAIYRRLMSETYGERDFSDDPAMAAWTKANTRACPQCSLLITWGGGCKSMICPCGQKFCFCCGKQTCIDKPSGDIHSLIEQQSELWKQAEKAGAKIALHLHQFELNFFTQLAIERRQRLVEQ